MKGFLKFILYSVSIVLGLALTSFLFSWFGELISTKNSFAVALGLMGVGVMLGAWGWLIVTGIKKGIRLFFNTDFMDSDDGMAKYREAAKGNCCQNECGCDRTR